MESENTVKQVLVWRADLRNADGQKVRTGKIVAQMVHASMGAILTRFNNEIALKQDESITQWLRGAFTKVCVRCDSEAELDDLHEKAIAAGITCCLIVDSGRTEFNGVPTKTALAVGPAPIEVVNAITGHLKLL